MRIGDIYNPNPVVHCETSLEADRILKLAHEAGYIRYEDYIELLEAYKYYTSETCYDILSVCLGSFKYYKEIKYKIISSKEIE